MLRPGACTLIAAALALACPAAAAGDRHRVQFVTADARLSRYDRRVLVAFANETNWRLWRQPWPVASWQGADPCRDGWAGVFCAPNGRVERLDLSEQGVHGVLHPALGQLGFLRELRLPGNTLRGPIPATLARLANLRVLDLSRNGFEGPVPSLTPLLRLAELNLARNPMLSGGVPSEVLLRLTSFDFGGTQVRYGSALDSSMAAPLA